MVAPLRFCLVTTAHVCNNPRLVKEADALSAAGHDVRVASLISSTTDAERDRLLVARRNWRHEPLDVRRGERGSNARWTWGAVAQAASRRLFARGVRTARVRDQALSRFVGPLARAAAAEDADIFIAHNLEALPAAVRAARTRKSRFGFDIEDYHPGVSPDLPEFALERSLIVATERAYYRNCTTLTASSDPIADVVAADYRVSRPAVVLNTFPRASAERVVVVDRVGVGPSLYWYSQTIGGDRGLDDALRAMTELQPSVQLHLRGSITPEYRATLAAATSALGLDGRVHLLPPAPPDDLVALAAQHDVGLALEQPNTPNRRLCCTNKLFTYLAAGLPVAATDTLGQRGVMATIGEGGFLYPAGNVAALATALRRLLADAGALDRARAASHRAGATEYAWERDAARLVEYLEVATTRGRRE